MSQTWRQDSLDGALWKSMFYTTYTTVRTAIITPILLVFIFVVLRAVGARTLTQATLFNRIVSVAVGSLVGSVALRPNSPLTSTVIATSIIVASALVVDLGYAWGLIPANVVQARPVLLYANDHMLTRQLHRCLLTADKVESELRSRGYSSLEKVYAVVLEPNGAFAVITREAAQDGIQLLQHVDGFSAANVAEGPPADGGQHQDGLGGGQKAKKLRHGTAHVQVV